MSAAAPPTPRTRMRIPAPLERLVARPSPLVLAITVGIALTLVSLYLRTRALNAGFWIDEALAVGVGSHTVTDIPSVLRLDGSPPLYYALLHGWMTMFGSTES